MQQEYQLGLEPRYISHTKHLQNTALHKHV